ncbi:ATP-binding cassette sub-family C member 5-like [Styela clava]
MGGNKKDNKPNVEFRRGGKYRNSAKALLPYRSKKAIGHPIDNAGFFSTVFYSWVTGLVWKLYRSPVPIESLWKVPKYDAAETNCQRFVRLWSEEIKNRGDLASLKRVIFRFIRTRLAVSTICILFFVLAQFASNGIVVRYLLQYVETSNSDLKAGILLVVGMLIAEVIRLICFSMSFAVSMRSGARTRAALTMAVFQKILQVPPTESSSVGEIVNLCSSDGDRVFDAINVGHLLLTGPIMFVVGTTYVCFLVGPIALSGCGIFILILLLQIGLMKVLNLLRQKAVKFTDQRVKSINEILSSIKLIKMYAWEESFTKVVHHIRNNEWKYLHRAMFLQSFNMGLAGLTPYVATIVTIVLAILLGQNITSSEAFTCFSMFHLMSFSLKVIPVAMKNVAEAGVAIDRAQKVLNRREFIDYLTKEIKSPDVPIVLNQATLSWPTESSNADGGNSVEKSDDVSNSIDVEKSGLTKNGLSTSTQSSSCLSNITMEIAKGSLIGVCGRVGSGKSSLVSSMLGYLQLDDGSVAVSGSIAYCAQQAWIMNDTIRDNITFGLQYDTEKYDRIVKACCLLPDFDILQSGDFTEVGERGVNMSGGQKQRINIARAIYMDKDIYLLDDPLSAVDAHVGKALFENAIVKLLKNMGKTIVLVTHRLEYLPYCDKVVLMKDGRIWEQGTHDELLNDGDEYYQLYKMWSKEKEGDQQEKPKNTIKEKLLPSVDDEIYSHAEKMKRGRLMTIEEKAKGAISAEAYRMYIKAAGGWFVTIFNFFTFILFIGCQQFSSAWMSYWLKQGSGRNVSTIEVIVNNFTGLPREANFSSGFNSTFDFTVSTSLTPSQTTVSPLPFVEDRVIDNPKLYFYLSVFGYTIAASVFSMMLKAYVFATLSLRASHGLHNMLFDKIMHSTMEFFDTTPTGRILNRFQKDQDMLDTIIPMLVDLVLSFWVLILSCLIFIAYVFPYFLASMVIYVPVFLAAFFIFKRAVTEMKRQDNITRSPWISHITTSITGIHTIRAYNRTKDFLVRFQELLDTNSIPYFLYVAINRWLVTRLDFMAISLVVLSSLLIVLTNGAIQAAYAGLAITSTLMLSLIFQFTARTSVEAEANFVCAERIVHYITTVPQEPKSAGKADLDPKWPEFGSVRFNNVKMRYRDGLPLVLQDISFTINTCEKIGVVGRTGSGKSSLGVVLFRLVELCGGSIEIDGVNIAELSLSQLRSKIAIIPQEPVLFTGTVKYNVDPFDQYSEEEIWLALERTHLKETILSLPMKLEAPVSENGGNFSVGERQLMCLTRALLRRNKVLILDEATASIDARTDRLVQDTVNEYFSDCTLITIAHRLHTVMTCDRIMVLDQGTVEEFDTPDVLSKNPDSALSKLLSSTMG